MTRLPLEGVKVVEIAQNLAGPFAGEILASMGADVVKVERPEGDDARRWGPRGHSLGATYQAPAADRHNYSREYLLARVTGALGGRAAEEIVFGNVTSGAENDLKQLR